MTKKMQFEKILINGNPVKNSFAGPLAPEFTKNLLLEIFLLQEQHLSKIKHKRG